MTNTPIEKIDVFAHVLPQQYRKHLLAIAPQALPETSWMNAPMLNHLELRLANLPANERQIISAVNLNADEWLAADDPRILQLCQLANDEMRALVAQYPRQIAQAVAMIPMQAPEMALKIIAEQVAGSHGMAGIQLFTTSKQMQIDDKRLIPVFEAMAKLDKPIWLHPVFDAANHHPDLTFDWEIALTKAMARIVKADYFKRWPNLKIIVHHAGAMVPYFSERIRYIQGPDAYKAYQHFYVDTALLGNPSALRLAADFFGVAHVLYGTDAPLGIPPYGAGDVISQAIENAEFSTDEQTKIFHKNWASL